MMYGCAKREKKDDREHIRRYKGSMDGLSVSIYPSHTYKPFLTMQSCMLDKTGTFLSFSL